MPKQTARNGIILINGYNFSTFATAYEASQDIGKIDVTGFGDGAQNFIPGLPQAKLTIDMLWDSTALTGVHAILNPRPNGVVTLLPEGYALGKPTINLPYTLGNYNPQGAVDGAIQVGQLDFASFGRNSYGVESGVALQHGIITNTLTGTGVDDPSGAAVTAVSGATLHVWTPTTTDTYVVKVQHSTAPSSGYVDLVTFTLNGTARNVERQVITSGVVNRYRRVLATRTGAGAQNFGFSVHFWHA